MMSEPKVNLFSLLCTIPYKNTQFVLRLFN